MGMSLGTHMTKQPQNQPRFPCGLPNFTTMLVFTFELRCLILTWVSFLADPQIVGFPPGFPFTPTTICRFLPKKTATWYTPTNRCSLKKQKSISQIRPTNMCSLKKRKKNKPNTGSLKKGTGPNDTKGPPCSETAASRLELQALGDEEKAKELVAEQVRRARLGGPVSRFVFLLLFFVFCFSQCVITIIIIIVITIIVIYYVY